MKKLIFLFSAVVSVPVLALNLPSITTWPETQTSSSIKYDTSHEGIYQKNGQQGLRAKVQELLRRQKWVELRTSIRKALQMKKVSLDFLEKIALEEHSEKLQEVIASARGLISLKKSANIADWEAYSLSSFILQELPKYLGKRVTFFDLKKYGIERDVQFDKSSNKVYIHLGTNGVKKIGEGFQKVVTKTIQFHPTTPVVMALAETTADISNEIDTLRAVKGRPGVLQAVAILKIPRKGGTTTGIVTPLFNSGSLQNVIDTKIPLTLKEKLIIARDLTQGLASLQEAGYVHLDIGARNHFVSIGPGKPGRRTVRAVVADFGRSRPYKKLKGVKVQGNTTYIAPEGYIVSKMMGKAYLHADLFGLGCTLWQLFFGEKTPWGSSREYRYGHGSMTDRQKRFTKILLEHTKKKKLALKKLSDKTKRSVVQVILQMLEFDPLKRGTAKQHANTLELLLPK